MQATCIYNVDLAFALRTCFLEYENFLVAIYWVIVICQCFLRLWTYHLVVHLTPTFAGKNISM